jgi:hypothetical protein
MLEAETERRPHACTGCMHMRVSSWRKTGKGNLPTALAPAPAALLVMEVSTVSRAVLESTRGKLATVVVVVMSHRP